jgi:hypothetical protein
VDLGAICNPDFVRRLFVAMLLMVPTLMVLSLATQDFPTLHSRFDIDGEATVPAWYATVILFSVALCSVVIHVLQRRANRDAKLPYHWLIFAVAYCFFSLDEAACIHEAFDTRLRIKWIYIYAPFAAIFFAYCAYYLIFVESDKLLSRWVLCGMSVFGLGALGMEAWTYFFYSANSELAEAMVEESLELIGTTIVFIGSLKGIRRLSKHPESRSLAEPHLMSR